MRFPTYVSRIILLLFVGICWNIKTSNAQKGTETHITFTEQNIEEARQQLRRILSEYPLDPWIITQEVQIKAGIDPHSRPILTLNTDYLDDDQTQLSIFVHEQAHWIPWAKRKAAIESLRELYPKIPGVPENNDNPAGDKLATYNHMVVAWVEFDAMTELVGKQKASQIIKDKVQEKVSEPYSAVEKSFIWYNERVLKDPQKIGSILKEHDIIYTPEQGIVIEGN